MSDLSVGFFLVEGREVGLQNLLARLVYASLLGGLRLNRAWEMRPLNGKKQCKVALGGMHKL